MNNLIHTISLSPDWKLIKELGQIDKFGGFWTAIERRESQSLKQLKSIATVRSVGASTRIEGSKMTNDEVEQLIKNLVVARLEERDAQEVAGYYETLDVISESFHDIGITENNLKMLHNILMKYSAKDVWHRGNYKQHSNVVEATQKDGSQQVVFRTTDPGFATEDAMRQLVRWYNGDSTTPPIVRTAIFVYDFLSIHPFQDGNGRLSRLLATLLMLRQGYSWIQYVSFEHEIESRKGEYYSVLMQCQRQRPGEDVYPWVTFFLNCLSNIQQQLITKLHTRNSLSEMSPREKKIYTFIENHPGCQSSEVSEKLDIPLPTVKRMLMQMLERKLLVKHGIGKGTNYTAETLQKTKTDLMFTLTNTNRRQEFLLMNVISLMEIKKILLVPLFDWKDPTEWGTKLTSQNISFKITGINNVGGEVQIPPRSFIGLINHYHFNPVVTLNHPITISGESIWERPLKSNEYPIKVIIEIITEMEMIFDVRFVYDSTIDYIR
jgi:Fic family protein